MSKAKTGGARRPTPAAPSVAFRRLLDFTRPLRAPVKPWRSMYYERRDSNGRVRRVPWTRTFRAELADFCRDLLDRSRDADPEAWGAAMRHLGISAEHLDWTREFFTETAPRRGRPRSERYPPSFVSDVVVCRTALKELAESSARIRTVLRLGQARGQPTIRAAMQVYLEKVLGRKPSGAEVQAGQSVYAQRTRRGVR